MPIDVVELRKRVQALQFRGDPGAPELAHELVSAVEEESGEISLASSDALDLLASCYLARGDGPRALRFFSKALQVGRAAGEPRATLAIRTSFLAFAHLLRGDTEPAVDAAKNALSLREDAPVAAQAKVAGNAAAVFAGARQLELAATLYEEVDTLLAPLDAGDGDEALEACTDRATAALNLGRTEVSRGNHEAAERALLRAMTQMERLRQLGLQPQEAQIETLRTTWDQLVEQHPVEAALREDFTRRGIALLAPSPA
jgi:tetratricopeptide (TPR) repeat protein